MNNFLPYSRPSSSRRERRPRKAVSSSQRKVPSLLAVEKPRRRLAVKYNALVNLPPLSKVNFMNTLTLSTSDFYLLHTCIMHLVEVVERKSQGQVEQFGSV